MLFVKFNINTVLCQGNELSMPANCPASCPSFFPVNPNKNIRIPDQAGDIVLRRNIRPLFLLPWLSITYHLPGVPWHEPNCLMDHPTALQGIGTDVTPTHAG